MINQLEPSVSRVTEAFWVLSAKVAEPSIVSKPFGSIVIVLVERFLMLYLKPLPAVAAAAKLTVIFAEGV